MRVKFLAQGNNSSLW